MASSAAPPPVASESVALAPRPGERLSEPRTARESLAAAAASDEAGALEVFTVDPQSPTYKRRAGDLEEISLASFTYKPPPATPLSRL